MKPSSSASLGEQAEVIRGVTFSKRDASSAPSEGLVPVLRAGNIQSSLETGRDLVFVPEAMVSERQYLLPNDIVMCTSSGSADVVGKTAFCFDKWKGSFGAFCAVLRTRSEKAEPRFLHHFLQSPRFRHWARNSSGINIKNIRKTELEALPVPAPPLDEQRRIAAILDKADAIRRKREQALALADDLLKSTFLEMFGDPVTNPRQLPRRRLGDVVRFVSGGTPSKAREDYWSGEFPWVSPKDMKVDVIEDAQDHVSDLVFEETSLKRVPEGVPLIVVRGMILAHTVPMAITGREVAINQDMKALLFDKIVDPVFGLWALKAQHGYLLSKVSTAAHGTKRFDLSDLAAVQIPIPPAEDQEKFRAVTDLFGKARARLAQACVTSNDLFASLSQRAFRGEL